MTDSVIRLGVVGQPSSGKDTVAEYIREHYGFTHLSTGDIIRKYVQDNNLGELTRPLLRDVGNQLRKEHGSDYLVQLALKDSHPRLIISGIRSVGEAETLKKNGGKLINIDVPIEKRYEWATARRRDTDHISFEEFKNQQLAEETNDTYAQNVQLVIPMADYTLENFGTLEELYKKIDELMTKIL